MAEMKQQIEHDTCNGKVRYLSYSLAEQVLHSRIRRSIEKRQAGCRLEPYACSCRGFHLGNSKESAHRPYRRERDLCRKIMSAWL